MQSEKSKDPRICLDLQKRHIVYTCFMKILVNVFDFHMQEWIYQHADEFNLERSG